MPPSPKKGLPKGQKTINSFFTKQAKPATSTPTKLKLKPEHEVGTAVKVVRRKWKFENAFSHGTNTHCL